MRNDKKVYRKNLIELSWVFADQETSKHISGTKNKYLGIVPGAPIWARTKKEFLSF